MPRECDLAELVKRLCLTLRAQWEAGYRVPVESHLARQPRVQQHAESALELVYQEVLLREERGERPQLAEYVARFPQLAPQLGPLFEVHEALESGGLRDLLL